jgi:hypothetical protein
MIAYPRSRRKEYVDEYLTIVGDEVPALRHTMSAAVPAIIPPQQRTPRLNHDYSFSARRRHDRRQNSAPA